MSADEAKIARRTEYLRMLRLVESGEVSVVLAYALDRLNRSLELSARFARAVEASGARLITLREGEVRQDTPSEWLQWTILATFADYDLRVMKARAVRADGPRISTTCRPYSPPSLSRAVATSSGENSSACSSRTASASTVRSKRFRVHSSMKPSLI
jgi:Resolvase, N terminal domain